MYMPTILNNTINMANCEENKMNIILYILIFIMGTVFGSFFTLAIYRIPKKQDITHTRSYCPNCEHKLGFLDMIPIFSYIFLGAKCRYCKQKIGPRYLILEVLSGLTFVLIAYLGGISITNLTINTLATSAFMTLYLCYIFLIAGIDKENRQIQKSVNIFGIIISILYMIYLCIVEGTNIYRYAIYIMFYVLILILNNITLKKYAKDNYINGLLIMIIIMAIFTNEFIVINTIIYALLVVTINILICKIKNFKNKKIDKQVWKRLSFGCILAISNILNLIFVLAYYKFLI